MLTLKISEKLKLRSAGESMYENDGITRKFNSFTKLCQYLRGVHGTYRAQHFQQSYSKQHMNLQCNVFSEEQTEK